MSDQHPKTGSLPPDLEKALREAGINTDTDLPVLDLDPVPVSHASGPAEYQEAIDAEIKRQWREWHQRHPDSDDT